MDGDVVDRHDGKVVLERSPARTTIDRELDANLVANEEKILGKVVLGNDVHRPATGQVSGDRLPMLAVVLTDVRVRREVTVAVPVERRVHATGGMG